MKKFHLCASLLLLYFVIISPQGSSSQAAGCECSINADCPNIGQACIPNSDDSDGCLCYTCPGISANPRWYFEHRYEAGNEQYYCNGVYSRQGNDFIIGTVLSIGVLTLLALSMASLEWSTTTVRILLLLSFPIADVVSDIVYVSTALFWDQQIFVLSVICLILPVCHFLQYLCRINASPKWYILSPPKAIQFTLDFSNAAQIMLYIVLHLPWLIINAPVLLPLFFFGCFLFMTKLFSVGKVFNVWMFLWTGTHDFDFVEEINTEMFNETYFSGVVMESLPQFLLQVTNTILTKQMNAITIVSITLSGLMVVNGAYRFAYFICWRSNLPMKDIPVYFFTSTAPTAAQGNQDMTESLVTADEDGRRDLSSPVSIELIQRLIREEVGRVMRTEGPTKSDTYEELRAEMNGLKERLNVLENT